MRDNRQKWEQDLEELKPAQQEILQLLRAIEKK